MTPRADTVGARPIASIEATRPAILTGDARQEVFQRLNRIALGTSFRAEVLSHLKDDSFVVKVADGAVRMNLPRGAQAGDKLDLTLVATQPRLTFLLGAPPAENTTSLSNAGRLIDSILHAAQEAGAPAAVVGKAPLAPSSDLKPEQLANAMKNALASSGVFYESHVGQWASGDRPLMSLMSEPQARNSDLALFSAALRAAANARGASSGSDAHGAETAHLMRLVETLQGKPEAAPLLMDLLRGAVQSLANSLPDASTADAGTPAAAPSALHEDVSMPAATVRAAEPMDTDSMRMISLQLNTLEQQRLAWQGELWPGQQIEWEIGEDTPDGKNTGAEERAWQSAIRFDLPALGSISANVRLAGERLQIQVRTADDTTASLLRAHGAALASALAAAGSTLELLTVKRDESPPNAPQA